jgi:hypothetical protein
MEKDTSTRDIEALRRMAPHKDAWVSSSLNGVGNALMLATPVFVGLDSKKGEKFIKETLKMPMIHERRLPITIGLGAIFGSIGLYQGLSEARRLKRYREARLDYSERMEKRLEAVEGLIQQKGWTEKVESPASEPDGPAR